MTTKNQKCKQPDCGRRWPYTGNKKKGGKTRCPDCQKTVTITALLALILIPLAGVAAADSQTVLLPLDRPFEDQQCRMFQTSEGVSFSCIWKWIVDPEVMDQIPRSPFNQTDYEIWLAEILPIVEDNPYQKTTPDNDDIVPAETEDEQTPRPLETLDPEVRRALDKLGECQFGVGGWAAFVANYTREVPDQLPIFTSGLDKQRVLGTLAKNFEECRGMTEYKWLSAEYENKFLADTLGLDYLGRSETAARGNEPSLMFEMTAEVTEAEKTAEADKWQTWMCADENLHLGLCGHEFSGTNRGGYTGGADCQIDGQPATEGGTAAQERCPLRELEAHQRNQPTTAEIFERVQEAICDTHLGQYEYLAIDKRPDWLSHCQ